MAFTDIREVELPSGVTIPVGHKEFAVGRCAITSEDTNHLLGFKISHPTIASLRSGVVTVVVTTEDGDYGNISIPWSGGKPVDYFHCTSSSITCVPYEVKYATETTDGAATVVRLCFADPCLAGSYVVCSLPGCFISAESVFPEGDEVLLSQAPSITLTEGCDYGTTEQRDALPNKKGQVFYVSVDD